MNWFERKTDAIRSRVESISNTIDLIERLRLDAHPNKSILNGQLDLIEHKLKAISDEIEEIRRRTCKLLKEE